MTKSNFKYTSGQSTASLFQPKKESKPYDPFNIQAASEPILTALEQNKQVEIGNLQRTGDYGLETMKIEHTNAVAVQEHNNRIAKINDEIKLEQFNKFSTAAQDLFQQGIRYKAEQSKKWAYTNLLKMPEPDRKILLENWNQLHDANGKFIDNAASGIILDSFSSPSSKIIAEDMLRATGFRRRALYQATLTERVAAIPQMMNHLYSSVRLDDPKYPANPTINELRDHQKTRGAENLTSDDLAYSNALQAKIAGQVLDSNFIPYYDAKEIYTKVRPVLDQYHGDTVQDIVNENERTYQENLILNKNIQEADIFRLGAVNPEINIAQKITDSNYTLWKNIDENGASGAFRKTLKGVLDLVRADKISTIEAREFLDEEIEVKGQCHIKRNGKCFTTLRLWRGDDITAVDFNNELIKIGAKDEGIQKLDYNGMLTYAKDNLQELFANSLNRPISTETMESLIDLVYKRVGGRRADIRKALYESVDTVQGLTDQKGLEQLAKDSDYGKRPRNPKDYQHISHEAMLKAQEKGYLTSSDSYLSKTELNQFGKDIGPTVDHLIESEGGTDLEAGIQGINIVDNAKRILEANYYYEQRTNPNRDKAENLANARQATLKFLADEKNLSLLKGPRLENNELATTRFRHEVELKEAGTNQVALSGLQYRLKSAIKEIQRYRAAGDKRPLRDLISATFIREDGKTGVFFDELWRHAARTAQQSPDKFLQTQLKLAGYNEQTNIYTIPEGDNKILEAGGPGANKRVDTQNTHPSNEDQLVSLQTQLKELEANKPKPERAGNTWMGMPVKPAKYRSPDGLTITPERDPGGLKAWEEQKFSLEQKIEALEQLIQLEEEGGKELIGEPVGINKGKLSDLYGYPISQVDSVLRKLGIKNFDIITEVELAHISRRLDLLYNPDTPFPQYNLYGGIA